MLHIDNNGFVFLRQNPVTFGKQSVMVIIYTGALFPCVIFTGMNFNPGKNCVFIDLCS